MPESIEHQLQTVRNDCFTITSKLIGLYNTVSCYIRGHISKEDMSMEAQRVIRDIEHFEERLSNLKINLENYITLN